MKKVLVIMLAISLIFVSGCWDKDELEQRLFVTEIGIDLNEEAKKEDLDKLIITYKYPNINTIGKSGGGGPKSYILSTTSSSIFQAGKQFMTLVPYHFYYKHLKVIILGEDLLKEGELVRSVLDDLSRDTKISKRVRILAAEGKAIDIIKATYVEEQRVEGTIYSIVRDNRHSVNFTSKSLTDLITESDIAGVSIIPKISIDGENRFIIEGGCVLKDYKFAGWIDRIENKALNLANGNLNIETVDVLYNNKIISYDIRNSSSKKKVKVGEDIIVDLDIELEGYLTGYYLSDEATVYSTEVISDMEKTIESDLKKTIEKAISHFKEMKADVFGIGEHLSKFHPREWRKLEEDWDDIIPEIVVNTNVDVKIRRTGLTK